MSQFDQINLKYKGKLIEVARAASFRTGQNVVKDTPVDKGMLINNWLTGLGAIDMNERGASMAGADSVMALKFKSDDLVAGQTLYFTNPMPYAPRIEYEGYSDKAPQGMLVKNTDRWQATVAQVAREIAND